MGQGLHTKTTQVASRVLGVPVEIIHQSENSTATIANSTTTAASSSTDLYGAAVQVRRVKLHVPCFLQITYFDSIFDLIVEDEYMTKLKSFCHSLRIKI